MVNLNIYNIKLIIARGGGEGGEGWRGREREGGYIFRDLLDSHLRVECSSIYGYYSYYHHSQGECTKPVHLMRERERERENMSFI